MRARLQSAGARIPRHLAILILLSFLPMLRPTGAQAITFGAWGGRYVPTPGTDSKGGITVKRFSHVIGGAQLSRYPKNRFGFELATGFSRAPATLTGSGHSTEADLDALLGSVTILTRLTPAEAPLTLFARTGPAWVHHCTPLDIVHGRSDYGLVLGLAVRRQLRGALGFRADAEDFIYRADYDAGRALRSDFVFRAGLEISKR